MKELEYKFPVYWTDKLKVDFLQRVILLHSYLYYECGESVWQDIQFDTVSKQLYELQQKHSVEWIRNKTQYGYMFYDFTTTTGFYLWDRANEKDRKAIQFIAKRR